MIRQEKATRAFRRVLGGCGKWALRVFAFVLGLVLLAVTFVLVRPELIRAPINRILAGVVAGKIEITRLESIRWNGISGANARLLDDSGRALAHAYDVSARLSWWSLVSDLISNDAALDIEVDELKLAHLHLDTSLNRQGHVAFLDALTPPPSVPGGSSRPVTISFDSIQLADGWVHGRVEENLLIDAKIKSLELSLSVAEELVIEKLRLSAALREPHQYETPVELHGESRIRFHETESVPADASFPATISSKSRVFLNLGASSIRAEVQQVREAIDATIDVVFAPIEAEKLGIELRAPLTAKLGVSGNLDEFTSKLEARYEQSRLDLEAHARHQENWAVDGSLAVQELDLRSFGVEPVSPLSARMNFSGTRREDGEVPELKRYSAQLVGDFSSFETNGRQVPALGFELNLSEAELNVKVKKLKEQNDVGIAETRLVVKTRLDPSGEIDELDIAGQVQAAHVTPYLKPLQHVQGSVQFDGLIGLSEETVRAHVNAQLTAVRIFGGISANSVVLDASADGSWSSPRLRAEAVATGIGINQERIERASLKVDGSLAEARVAVQLARRGLSAEVNGKLGIVGAQVSLTEVSGSVAREANQQGFKLGSATIQGSRVDFKHLALDGVVRGEVSGSVNGDDLELKGSLRDVSLYRVGQMLELQLPMSGQLDADLAIALKGSQVNGRVHIEGSELVLDKKLVEESQAPVPPMTPLRLSLDVVGEGGVVSSFVHLREMVELKRQAFEIDLRARTELPPRSRWGEPLRWWQNLLQLNLKAEAPLKETSRAILPVGWQSQGHLGVRLQLKREAAGAAPRFTSRVTTTGLKLVFPKPAANGTDEGVARETLEEFDVDLRLRHNPERRLSVASVKLFDAGKPWVRVRAEVKASLDELMNVRTLTDLRQLEFDVNGRVPKRDVKSWPKLLQVEGLRGVWGGRFFAKGTLEKPEAEASLRFSDWRSTSRESDFRISGGATVKYDSRMLAWETEFSGEREENLRAEGSLEAPWNARELKPEFRALNLKAEMTSIPLHALSAMEHQNIRGPIDLKLRVENWGTPLRKAEAKLELGDVYVRGISLQGAHLHLSADAAKAEGAVHLRNKKFFVEGKGMAELLASSHWLPKLGDSLSGEFEAKDVPLQLLRPLVSAQLAGLAGTVSANLKASQRADERNVEATVQVRDARVQVPSVGQRLQDINLDLKWDKLGSLSLRNATFRGTSGKGKLEADVKMKGIEPQTAKLRLVVDRNERLPISLLGAGTGEFWGDLQNEFEFDWEQQKISIRSNVKEFQMQFPELPTGQLQSLEPDEHIQVGTRGEQGDWLAVALQPIEQKSEGDPWNIVVAVDLGKKFWLQQGPTRRIQLGGGLEVEALANEEVRVTGQLNLARGRIELNGRMFEVREGTITFQPEDPSNPIIVAAARWESPEGTTVIARFSGPVKSGEMTLTSDPPLPEDQVLSLVLFGDTSGLGNVGTGQEETDNASQAAAVGGSVASQGLNQALSRIEGVDVSTRVAGGDSGNVRPEVVVQLTNALSAEVGYNLQEPSPGKSPDRTLVSIELRVVGGHSLSATVGDRGTSLLDWVWRYRY